MSESLVAAFENVALISKYDVYEVLLTYWNEVMADDAYVLTCDSYGAGRETENVVEVSKGKDGIDKETVKGWEGKLIPKALVESTYFAEEREAITILQAEADDAQALLDEWVEEQSGEDGLLETEDSNDDDNKEIKINAKFLADKLAEIRSRIVTDELTALGAFLEEFTAQDMKKKDALAYVAEHPLCVRAVNEKGGINRASIIKAMTDVRAKAPVNAADAEIYEAFSRAWEWADTAEAKTKEAKEAEKALDAAVRAHYDTLTDDEVKLLLVDLKWYASIRGGIDALYVSASHALASRVSELCERYETTLSDLTQFTEEYEAKVKAHLERMGFVW